MSKNKMYCTKQEKTNKNQKTLKGGYASSLTGISQSERNELSKETFRGTGKFENKKRKEKLKRKSRYTNYDSDSAFYFFAIFNIMLV